MSGRATLAALALAFVAMLARPQAAAACSGPVPDFRQIARDATQVVLGEVTAVEHPNSLGYTNEFTLRVDDVLRGRAPSRLQLDSVPTQPCNGSVYVRLGDVVAIAFDGTDPDITAFRVNAHAVIRGEAVVFEDQRMSREEVYAAAGARLPDTATDAAPSRSGPGLGTSFAVPVVAAILSAIVVLWRRRSASLV